MQLSSPSLSLKRVLLCLAVASSNRTHLYLRGPENNSECASGMVNWTNFVSSVTSREARDGSIKMPSHLDSTSWPNFVASKRPTTLPEGPVEIPTFHFFVEGSTWRKRKNLWGCRGMSGTALYVGPTNPISLNRSQRHLNLLHLRLSEMSVPEEPS